MKRVPQLTVEEAAKLVPNGAIIMAGGFGMTGNPVHLPRIVFSQLSLGGLADDPVNGEAGDLPYPNLQHLRDVLMVLQERTEKRSKLVLKQATQGVFYRTVRGGFYVGDQQDFACYRFPDIQELETHHYSWWRSAQSPSLDI